MPTTNKRLEPRPRADWVEYRDHHPAYVTREVWETIQAILAGRRPSVRPPLGKGAALLQGLLWCAKCDRWMRTVSDGTHRGTRVPMYRYLCRPVDRLRKPRHKMSCSALLLDRVISRAVLSVISPPEIQAALTVVNELRAESESVQETQIRQLRRLNDEVVGARREYQAVDPAHRLVKADLEVQLEEAIRRRDEFKQQLDNAPVARVVSLAPDEAARLVTIAADLIRLWNAPSTTNEDRKRLLQTVIFRILVQASTDEYVDIVIIWAGGLREPHRI